MKNERMQEIDVLNAFIMYETYTRIEIYCIKLLLTDMWVIYKLCLFLNNDSLSCSMKTNSTL